MNATITTPLPADIPDAYGTEATVDCRRCQHTGIWNPQPTALRSGVCFACQGSGIRTFKRYTEADKEQITRWFAWRTHTQESIDARGDELDADTRYVFDRIIKDHARWGLDLLETSEPRRVLALFASIQHGRLDDVIAALGEYWRRDNKQRNPGQVAAMLINGVRAHAQAHYEQGWEIVVEATTDEELLEHVGEATTIEQAIANVRRFVEIHNEHAAGIRATAF